MRRGEISPLGAAKFIVLALTLTGTARAQTSPNFAEQIPAENGGIAEVLVTAEKQQESLQKTAAAITAIAGDTLVSEGITNLRDAQMTIPAVRFQQEGYSTQVFIRGVGANQDLAPVEQNVAFNFNGVYIPREGTSTGFFDLASMEVLPGPQGTLYGRSAVGGTINVSFARPDSNWEGSALAEGGNFSAGHVTVAQNLPLNSTLALRLAGDYSYRDGYMSTGSDSANDGAGRLSVSFNPFDSLSVYAWSQFANRRGSPPNLVNKGTNPVTGQYDESAFLNSNAWNDYRYGRWAAALTFPFTQPTRSRGNYDSFLNGAQIDWQLAAGLQLTYIPSYIFVNSRDDLYWLGVIPARIRQKYNMTSHELRLSGKSEALKWLGGVYAYRQHNSGFFTVFQDVFGPYGLVNSNVPYNLLEGVGVFGQATYAFTHRLRLTAGGRYSSDRRRANGSQTEDPGTGAPIGAFSFAQDYSNVDYKAAVEFDLTDRAMVYGAVQTGYAPGTYNSEPTSPTDPNAPGVRKIKLRAFSLGLKSRFAQDTVQVNPEFFYYDYRNLILQQYDISQTFNPIFNAQKIRIWGGQGDVLWKLTRHDQLNLNIGYTHARNVTFITPDGGNFNGLSPPYSPDTTAIGGYEHSLPLPSGASLRFRIEGRFESSWYADYVHNRGVRQGASAKGDAFLNFESAGDWVFGIWVKNFTNEAVLAATAAAGFPGPATAYLEAPRTYGARFTIKYGGAH